MHWKGATGEDSYTWLQPLTLETWRQKKKKRKVILVVEVKRMQQCEEFISCGDIVEAEGIYRRGDDVSGEDGCSSI